MNRANEPPLPEPLAYFLTWSTYGTWLPGDERGWVEYGHGFQPASPVRQRVAAAGMTDDPCWLDQKQRDLVEKTIEDHCNLRGWTLHAVNCRSNHLHVVVTADRDPDTVREQFKAWCTRKLKEMQKELLAGRGQDQPRLRTEWWTERGSDRYINDDRALEAAIQYVKDYQDTPDRGGLRLWKPRT